MAAAKKPVDAPGGERTLCSTMVICSPRNRILVLTVSALLCIGASAAWAGDGRRAGEAAPAAGGDAPSGWDMALTGGFVATGLVDPVYALGNVAGQPTRVVLRQPDQESTVNLGVAMFAQVYHDRYAWIAPLSFGIGLRGGSRATFYLGSALRLGSHASFTAGVAIGPIAALPAGVVEGRAVTDTNFLTNLGTRTTSSWFTGVTYTFASLK
jgi:hypothetical protein